MTFTLTEVWQDNGTERTILPSLPYHNNLLHNCKVTSIYIDSTGFNPTAAYLGYAVIVNTYLSCSAAGPAGLIHFNLSQSYNYRPDSRPLVPPDRPLLTDFLGRNPQSRASLWYVL